ncbi:ATP-binding protein [Prosthecomicrobium sp. N25]|uniref:ATP-binding protein n=1 Tax=Prosthecomicrobium sp. N25 TaxID=3129254 RepID=UPI003077DC48
MRIDLEILVSLLALDPVGQALDDARPALVLAADGTPLLANAAAAALGAAGSERAAVVPDTILRQAVRFAERSPAGTVAVELVRVPTGLKTTLHRVELHALGQVGDGPAVLLRLPTLQARGSAGEPGLAGSLALLEAPDRLLAAFDAAGDVIAAYGDYALLDGSQDEIERFVIEADGLTVARKAVETLPFAADAALVVVGGRPDLRVLFIARRHGEPVRAAVPAAPPAGASSDVLDPVFMGLAPLSDLIGTPIQGRPGAAPALADAGAPEPEVPAAPDIPAVAITPAPPFPGATPEDLGTALGFVAEAASVEAPPAAAAARHATTEDDKVQVVEVQDGQIHDEQTADAQAPGQEQPIAEEPVSPPPVEAVEAGPSSADVPPETVKSEAVPERLAPVEGAAEADGEGEPLAGPARDDFVFSPEARPRRFVWQMDAAERFTFLSEDLATAVGPRAADLVGLAWSAADATLGLDPAGRIRAALERRDTWSGLTVLWPVQGEPLRVPVDLAALPAFDRHRAFEGYRGFGVCRTSEAVPDPAGTGLRLQDRPRQAPEEPAAEPEAEAAAPLPSPDRTAAETPPAEEPTLQAASEEPETGAATASAAASDAEPAAVLPALEELTADEIREAPAPPEDAFAGETDEALPEPLALAEPEIVTAPQAAAEVWAPQAAAAPESAAAQPAPEPTPSIDDAAPPPERQAPAAEAPPPGRTESRVVTVPANRGSRIVTLPTAVRSSAEPSRLSAPERIAFRQIAAALGARLEGEDDNRSGVEKPGPAAPAPHAPEGGPEARIPSPPAEPETPAAAAQAGDATEFPGETALLEAPPADLGAAPAAVAEPEAVATAGVTDEAARILEPAPAEAEPVAEAPPAILPPAAPDEAPAAPAPVVAEAPAAPGLDLVPSAFAPPPGDIAAATRVLDRIPLGAAVLKAEALAHVNPAFLDLLGYKSPEDLEGAGGLEAIFAGEHVARRFFREDANGEVRPLAAIGREGEVIPVNARLASIPWGPGTALLMTLTRVPRPAVEAAVETPSGRAALEALREARERANELEAIIDTATDGVLMIDGDGRVVSANRAAEALFGTERAEMGNRPLVDLLAPESRRSAQDYLEGLARNGVASVLNDGREVIGQVRPEGLIPLFMTIGRISSGPSSKFCAVLRDITQWKKSEEELTAARRRAEAASVHKSEFLAKISHEIRTPLNAIIGFSELMLDERFGTIGNERYKDYLKDVHTSGTHIMSLINDLLDLSKVEAGKMELKFEAVSLADVLGECVAIMQPQANRERIIIRTSLPASVPPVVADPRSVRQIVLNLLSNAVKFTPAGGQVIVSTSLEDSGEVVVRVRDTGYGMTDKEIQTALEPFRQLHTTRVRGGGTGLGLPLTKALVEANRATFRIDSAVNQGTLVSITFPVTRVLAG